MPKETRLESPPLTSMHKHSHVVAKFAISLLLMGLAFRLFFSDTVRLSSVEVETPPPAEEIFDSSVPGIPALPIQTPDNGDLPPPANQTQTSQNAKCDMFLGDWIPDPSGPSYTNDTCRVMEAHQNCMKNGRPDSEFLHWRWKPRNCELPKFNPLKFLDLMRNKSWGFIGDSIQRNHVQSLLCLLSQVEEAVEVYHDEEYRSKRWHFPSHNFTLSVIWAPYLVKAVISEDMNGVSSSETQLYLDELDTNWTTQFKSFDYVVIGGGKWFLKTAIYHENYTVVGCHNCDGKNLTEKGFEYSYQKAIELIFNYIMGSGRNMVVFFRTTTPDHFENGEWFSGGYCNRTVPFKEGEVEAKVVDTIMRNIELEEFGKAIKMESKAKLNLLDTTSLSLLRPDGHPGPYRKYQPFAEDKNAQVQKDCLHWCLPGPIDSWNELILELLVNADKYT